MPETPDNIINEFSQKIEELDDDFNEEINEINDKSFEKEDFQHECSECGKKFATLRGLKGHISRTHDDKGMLIILCTS